MVLLNYKTFYNSTPKRQPQNVLLVFSRSGGKEVVK